VGDIAFNISKAKAGYYAGLPDSSDALVLVVLEASGLEDDDTLVDYDTLGDLLDSNTEQTDMGRKTLSTVTVTVDDTNDWVTIKADDVTWSSATGNATGAVVICYDPNTGTSTDDDRIPLSKHDYAQTPSGSNLSQALSTGFLRIA